MADRVLTADIIAQASLAVLDNELGVLGTLYRAPEKEFSQRVNGYAPGETVSIRRPADYTVRKGATAVPQDSIEGKVGLTVDQQTGVDFDFTSADLTLSVEDLTERFIQPAVVNIVNDMAADVFDEMYKGVYNWAGTPGQIIDSFDDFSKGPERLDELAAPQSMRNAALSPADYWGMLGSNVGLFVQTPANDALRQAQLGTIGNTDTWMTQVVPTHTVGAGVGSPVVEGAGQEVLYDAVKDTWAQDLITSGWTASSQLLRGDVFTIAGVNMVNPKTRADTGILQQFVVNADVLTDAVPANPTTVNVSPPIIVTGPYQTVAVAPADAAQITYVGTPGTAYKQNLCYHKNAMALAVVPMVSPPGAVQVSRQTKNGLSVRVIPVYQGLEDVSLFRLDLLYGRRLIDPRIATRFSGSA